jgi:hypothetical protein
MTTGISEQRAMCPQPRCGMHTDHHSVHSAAHWLTEHLRAEHKLIMAHNDAMKFCSPLCVCGKVATRHLQHPTRYRCDACARNEKNHQDSKAPSRFVTSCLGGESSRHDSVGIGECSYVGPTRNLPFQLAI